MINREKAIRWATSGLLVVIFVAIVVFVFTRPNASQIGLPAKDGSCAVSRDAGLVDVKAQSSQAKPSQAQPSQAQPSQPKSKSSIHDAGAAPGRSKSFAPDASIGARSKTSDRDGGAKVELYSRRD